MNIRTQRLGVWAGPLFCLLFAIGMIALAQFIPPPKASDSASEIAKLYSEDTDRLRAGLVLMMLGAGFIAPWGGAITTQLKRIEGRHSPVSWSNLAWILFVMVFPPVMVQELFGDEQQSVYPRWVGYFNAWCAVLLLPAIMIPFFKSGPFAWHGIFKFWLAAVVFFGWVVVMTIATFGAISRQEAEGELAVE